MRSSPDSFNNKNKFLYQEEIAEYHYKQQKYQPRIKTNNFIEEPFEDDEYGHEHDVPNIGITETPVKKKPIMGKNLSPLKGGALAMSSYTHKPEVTSKNLLERFHAAALQHPESSGDE